MRQATRELHKMFLDATDYVLTHSTECAPRFLIPTKLWPLIRKSW